MDVSDEHLVETYTNMVRSRTLDERFCELHGTPQMKAMWHSGWGEEAQCGLYTLLRPDDYTGYTHRGAHVWASKGIPFGEVMAEFFGKATGCAKGKGGTHVVDLERGVLGRAAMQGGHFPLFAGAGIAIQIRGSDQVSVVSFGDGAATIGLLHESMNFAAVWKLPVIYFCANNSCSETERLEQYWGQPDVAKIGIAYDMPYEIVGDNDTMGLIESSGRAIARARAGDGPTIIELKTFRMRAHMERDPWDFGDRSRDEIAAWREKDAIAMFGKVLSERGLLTEEQAEQIKADAAAEVAEAERFADESPTPDDSEAFEHIYGELTYEQVR